MAQATPPPESGALAIPTIEAKKKGFFPWHLKVAAALYDSKEPHSVRLGRVDVSDNTQVAEEDRTVTPIPALSDADIAEVDFAAIINPFSFVRVTFHNTQNEYLYEVIEPPVGELESALLTRLKTSLIDEFKPLAESDPETKKRELRRMVDLQLRDMNLYPGPVTKGRVLYYLERDFIGYGIVDAPMRDTEVEDISCDGVGIPLYIYHRKYGSIKSNLKFTSAKDLDAFVVWIAQRSGRHISVANPMLDATMPDGSRLQATLGTHITKRGSSFTVRRFRDNPFTPVDLIKFKTMSSEMMAYLWMAIENGQSMMVCGGTASGKTTTLNAVLLFIPPQMKIVSIEDTRELNLPHENWIPSLTRVGFGAKNVLTGKAPGEIDMFDLLATALRQRPQYLMVGEVRGAEAFIVFQAMATGKTCYTTFHAESVSAMVHRMENPPISLPRSLVAALNLVLLQKQVKVQNKMTRRVQSLTEIVGIDPETNELITNAVYSWNPGEDTFLYSGHSYIYERIAVSHNWNMKDIDREVKRRVQMLEYFKWRDARATRQTPFTHRDVGRLISSYYKDPQAAVAEVNDEMGRARAQVGPPSRP